jgi:hypothetical protein
MAKFEGRPHHTHTLHSALIRALTDQVPRIVTELIAHRSSNVNSNTS